MPSQKKEPSGCGCSNIPISIILIILGGGYWWFSQRGYLEISKFLDNSKKINIHIFNPTITNSPTITPTASIAPSVPVKITSTSSSNNNKIFPKVILKEKIQLPQTPWEKKVMRGIYLTRYQVTNNADEQTIRERVRYYRSQGINTIIHGVWGNGCTMYNSEVMQQSFGYKSCPNQFQDQWLNWLIDEAHKQGMQVHAYFEKGIKIDKNSPILI
ncbi:hypothetical protein ANSO36C_63870 (plasmid) [Nostoc cf. commune SO-36]|uniref:Glycosyl hydrolase-like 10 domain-containing protein n=1 Tax=Nostoc cf. commune SO-36 TaxID=449208 RepID=A0ABN6QDA7_NOSCO|nr:hypothetical protein ANSO36C_63870 [Nostoc cf. commune SO-36]